MKLYIYDYVSGINDSYHSGGGLVIITDKDPAGVWDSYATDLNREEGSELDTNALYDQTPSLVVDVSPATTPDIYVFPDAGCC
ncbi:hypothetical protein [Nocardia grenadensis]|uniref:hypothetical protein n=1 Tax=Nocardia grenadensis TaxID=931537 RepID=UPI003D70E00A